MVDPRGDGDGAVPSPAAPNELPSPRPLRTAIPRPTDRIPLGSSAVEASPWCLGWVADPDTVLAAYDLGINFFFVPTDYHLGLYRHSIEGLRRLLARGGDVRDRIVVAGVGYIENPSFFPVTLRELLWICPELERLEVGVAGAVAETTAGRIEQLHAMRSRGDQGLRVVGASFHARTEARQAIERRTVDVAFVRYNPVHPGALEDLFPFVGERQTAIYNFTSSFGYLDDAAWASLGLGDHWRPELHDHYRFVLSRPAIDGILCAPRVPAHLERIVRAVEAGPLDADEEQHMLDLALLATGKASLAPEEDSTRDAQ